jgi:hypothetical protein
MTKYEETKRCVKRQAMRIKSSTPIVAGTLPGMRDRRNNSRIAIALQSGTFVVDTLVYGIGPIDQGSLRLSRICPAWGRAGRWVQVPDGEAVLTGQTGGGHPGSIPPIIQQKMCAKSAECSKGTFWSFAVRPESHGTARVARLRMPPAQLFVMQVLPAAELYFPAPSPAQVWPDSGK